MPISGDMLVIAVAVAFGVAYLTIHWVHIEMVKAWHHVHHRHH
jgi:hypothetical protein